MLQWNSSAAIRPFRIAATGRAGQRQSDVQVRIVADRSGPPPWRRIRVTTKAKSRRSRICRLPRRPCLARTVRPSGRDSAGDDVRRLRSGRLRSGEHSIGWQWQTPGEGETSKALKGLDRKSIAAAAKRGRWRCGESQGRGYRARNWGESRVAAWSSLDRSLGSKVEIPGRIGMDDLRAESLRGNRKLSTFSALTFSIAVSASWTTRLFESHAFAPGRIESAESVDKE